MASYGIGLPSVLQISVGVLGATAIAVFSERMKFLTVGGAIVQWLIGIAVFGIGGWPTSIPILAFFLGASLLSKFADARRLPAAMEGKGSRRDGIQVLANGGIAAGLVLLGLVVRDPKVYLAYVGALAAASADTFATEIGTVYGSAPRLITTGKPVTSGTSGAVTMVGLLGGVAGAGVVVAASVAWLGDPWPSRAAAPILGGIAGSIVDSVMGASVQARFLCTVCGKTTENAVHCNEPCVHVSGVRAMTNDAVNIVCTAAGAIVCVLLS